MTKETVSELVDVPKVEGAITRSSKIPNKGRSNKPVDDPQPLDEPVDLAALEQELSQIKDVK